MTERPARRLGWRWHRGMLRLPIGLAIGFVSVLVTVQAIDRFAPSDDGLSGRDLGPPDLDGYCARTTPPLRAVTVTGGADGWNCVGLVERLWTSVEVDIGDVCRWTFAPNAKALVVDASSSDGWRCVTGPVSTAAP
ncbi:MAG: hypothetical protein ACO3D0_10720 [Ilumatobacteraceae bacterium]